MIRLLIGGHEECHYIGQCQSDHDKPMGGGEDGKDERDAIGPMFVQTDDAPLRHSHGFLTRRTGPVDAMDHRRDTVEFVLGNASRQLKLLQRIYGTHVRFQDDLIDIGGEQRHGPGTSPGMLASAKHTKHGTAEQSDLARLLVHERPQLKLPIAKNVDRRADQRCQCDGYDGHQDAGHRRQEQTSIVTFGGASVHVEEVGHSMADAIPRNEGQDGW